MANEYIKHEDVLDVRDIAAQVRKAGYVAYDADTEDFSEDERDEAREALEAYASALDRLGVDYEDGAESLAAAWEELDGPTMIREPHWENYVEEYLKELGYLPRDLAWFIEIDWSATAENVRQDYTDVELDGVTYYIRLD